MQLGDRVMFDQELTRHHRYNRRVGAWYKFWESEKTRERFGVLVGLRTLQNGYCHYAGPDDMTCWERSQSVPCALVATGIRRDFVKVPLDALTVLS